jgi:hypothetical protein
VRVVHLDDEALGRLIDERIDAAARLGSAHIRSPRAFREHLIGVARRAERIARRLQKTMPLPEAPDAVAAYVAGAWHDGGKIRVGDDFHEIASARDILDHGVEWRLVNGPESETRLVLRRAARAVLAGFALYEQWQPTYRPTFSARCLHEAEYRRVQAHLRGTEESDQDDAVLLLPYDVDTLVLMYSDMCTDEGASDDSEDHGFASRWTDIVRRAAVDDPGLASVLPVVRERVRQGCALVQGWLEGRCGDEQLAPYRRLHSKALTPRR